MVVEFWMSEETEMGEKMRALGWQGESCGLRVTVHPDGKVDVTDTDTNQGVTYTLPALEELAELFTDAVRLARVARPKRSETGQGGFWEIGQELSLADLEALPVGAVVNDGDGSKDTEVDQWVKRGNGWSMAVAPFDTHTQRASVGPFDYSTRPTLVSLP